MILLNSQFPRAEKKDVAKKSKASSFASDAERALWTAGFAIALGFAWNIWGPRPLAIFDDGSVHASGEEPSTPITLEEFAQRLKADDKLLLLDVRDDEDYEKGHYPYALHVPVKLLQEQLPRIAPNLDGASLIVTLCDSELCGMAEEAVERLRKIGYKKVRVLKGGWEAWLRSDLPRIKGKD